MKKGGSLLLILCLIAMLFTACGEKQETTTTTTTTVVTTTTTKATTTTTTTTTTATTTTTTTTTTTAKPTGTLHIVDPKNYKDNHYYVGALQSDGNGLARPRILFEGEYAVVMHYMYSAVKEDEDQQPFEYGGKIYYGVGESMSPYQFEMTKNEILIKTADDNALVMKLVLRNDGTMYVTHTTDLYFPEGLILTPTAQ